MSDPFDPYHAWLRIPPSKRPPSPYDLLGIGEGESDVQRIRRAAAARYEQIRAFALGPHGDHALKLQNEVSEALVALTRDAPEEPHPITPPPIAPPAAPEPKPPLEVARFLAPLVYLDNRLRTFVGEENTILHGFLRGSAAVALLLVLFGLFRAISTPNDKPPEDPAPLAARAPAGDETPQPARTEATENARWPPGAPGETQPPSKPDEPSPPLPDQEPPEHQAPLEPPAVAPPTAQPPKSGPPPGEEPEPERAAPQGPFSELADAVDLPEWDGRSGADAQPPTAFTIGSVHADPGVAWHLFLLGGHRALDEDRAFLLQPDDPRDGQQAWVVQLKTLRPGGDAARNDTARIWRDQTALRFQWAENAPSGAGALGNCALLIRAGTETKSVALTQPKKVDPIPIDLDRETHNRRVPIEGLPRSGSLRVEITGIDGWESHTLDPSKPAEAETPITLKFPRTDRHGNTVDQVTMQITFSPRSSDLQVDLKLLSPKADAFQRLKREARGERNGLQSRRDALNRALAFMNRQTSRRNGTQPLPGGLGSANNVLRQDWNEQLDALDMNIWCLDFYDKVHRKARIHFRLFTEVEGRRIVLAST